MFLLNVFPLPLHCVKQILSILYQRRPVLFDKAIAALSQRIASPSRECENVLVVAASYSAGNKTPACPLTFNDHQRVANTGYDAVALRKINRVGSGAAHVICKEPAIFEHSLCYFVVGLGVDPVKTMA